ncbi:hypothetical protein F0562_026495 [Nyssa sinensis]|uniref:trehalose-phosphatase n=1 Tax=Nyssa sinensis TaxID=561372 RepID=A0A5J5B9C8_9ASTE|nr:hypothetical protein F0562_026495 [Nyssa sinensis]
MTKRYAILQKKLQELESELIQVFALPAETPCHHLLSDSIEQRFVFLKSLLSAEIASHPSNPHHLRHIAQRLTELETAFHDWDDYRTTALNDFDIVSTCSCTESCLNDDGECSPELGSSVYEVPETFSEAVVVEEKALEVAETVKVVEEKAAEERDDVKREEGETVGFWRYFGVMANGMIVGAALMGFVMAFGYWFCADSVFSEVNINFLWDLEAIPQLTTDVQFSGVLRLMDCFPTSSDKKTLKSAPVLADPPPMNKSRLSIHSALPPYSPRGAAFSQGVFLSIPRKKTGILERTSSWLDAMKSSSPTHKKTTKASSTELPSSDTDVAYRNWMLKYPSALASFEKITNYAKGRTLALFLDYDGTLSPIVDNPDCAFMSKAMRDAVSNVAKHFPTAIISGRSRDKVYEFVELTELYYAGSHGMDILGPVRPISNDHPNCIRSTNKQGKEVNLFQPASEFLPMIDKVFRSLVEITKEIKGAKVENNKFCVSVHYRNVDEKSWKTIGQIVQDIIKDYPRLRLTHGRKVLEVRPVLSWDKGKAVEFLLESLGLSNCDDVLPIYVGDDRTDEDAFKVLREGNRGYGILVSSVPKESNAFYSLRDPSEVHVFLCFSATVIRFCLRSGNSLCYFRELSTIFFRRQN